MKTKFKTGDRVTVVDVKDTQLEVGMTGTVVNCRKSMFTDPVDPQGKPLLFVEILFDNNTEFLTGEYFEYRFELIQKTQIKA